MENNKVLSTNEIGYLSLAVCILTTMTIDEAFEKIAPDPDVNRKAKRREEDQDIIALRRDKVSWSKIGEIFNMTSTAVFHRAQKFKA